MDDARQGDSAGLERLQGEQGVVYGAEPAACDEHGGPAHLSGEVGGEDVSSERHEESAGRLHEDYLAARCARRDGAPDRGEVHLAPLERGGELRGRRELELLGRGESLVVLG